MFKRFITFVKIDKAGKISGFEKLGREEERDEYDDPLCKIPVDELEKALENSLSKAPAYRNAYELTRDFLNPLKGGNYGKRAAATLQRRFNGYYRLCVLKAPDSILEMSLRFLCEEWDELPRKMKEGYIAKEYLDKPFRDYIRAFCRQ